MSDIGSELDLPAECSSTRPASDVRWEEEFLALAQPPSVISERSRWREGLAQWRSQARSELRYDDVRYERNDLTWSSTAFVCGVVMLWDTDFFDVETGRFTVSAFLDRAEASFGGFDLLVLWHAYPRIGFDERNQFDFYRDLPGGLLALREIIDELHRRGIRAVLDYNPWDTGTRPEGEPDEVALERVVVDTGADAVFLDTLATSSSELFDHVAGRHLGVVLQAEHLVPLNQVFNHQLTWAQWPTRLDRAQVLRNTWFEPRQMQHIVRRWDQSHTDELHTAWLNGCGVVMWENIFGSWYPWTTADKELLKAMQPIHKTLGRFFTGTDWTPFVATNHPEIEASLWQLDGVKVWTIVNRSNETINPPFLANLPTEGWTVTHVLSSASASTPLTGHPAAPLDPQGIGIVLAEPADSGRPFVEGAARRILQSARQPGQGIARSVPFRRRATIRTPRLAVVPPRMQGFGPATTTLISVFRNRECGTYERADFVDQAYPELDGPVSVSRDVTLTPFAMDEYPVTNAQFADFLSSSGYQPRVPQKFLAHWPFPGSPSPQSRDQPVTWLDLEDARAYARWSRMRLPTEDEWQYAMATRRIGYLPKRVWEWTESESKDSHNRFCIVKGGSDFTTNSSAWYSDSGQKGPEHSSKFILFHPGLDRCSTIGFRCVVDLTE